MVAKMGAKYLILVIFLSCVTWSECFDERGMEARGKKKKIAVFVYIADLILKKFFVLKLIYAFIFWVVLHKAGYFLAWFASYLKEQKKEHHHPHYDHQSYYGPYKKEYNPYYSNKRI